VFRIEFFIIPLKTFQQFPCLYHNAFRQIGRAVELIPVPVFRKLFNAPDRFVFDHIPYINGIII
jgi:hypothetical protein